MKKTYLIVLLIFSYFISLCQQEYWVFFTDKKDSKFNPYEYFDSKAIERRNKLGISLYDSTDFPVNDNYVKIISESVDSVTFITRWFNGVCVIANDEQIKKIENFTFVKKTQPIFLSTFPTYYDTNISILDSELLSQQISIMQGENFITSGITGKGVRIAVFDAGFPGVDVIPVFEHLRNNNQILKTYDFAKGKDFVYSYNEHGTMVLSCIAGKFNGRNFGLATDAEFLLARTEVNSEPYSEEKNWLAAAEWADKNGADIISSSLGYTIPRYFQYQMDGKSTLVAQAAKMASDKGILVVNAMGNDGDGKWKLVGTPADVEEVLSVGGVEPDTKIHINFSSFGPTADGRLKPEVCAAGKAFLAGKNGLSTNYGTSFATPLVTGFAACVLQMNPNLTNMQLKSKIIESAHLYPYFDYASGYGIPQAGYFSDSLLKDTVDYFSVEVNTPVVNVKFNNTDSLYDYSKDYFYYHFRYQDGSMSEYFILNLFDISENKLEIDYSEKQTPIILMMHYKGNTKEILLSN